MQTQMDMYSCPNSQLRFRAGKPSTYVAMVISIIVASIGSTIIDEKHYWGFSLIGVSLALYFYPKKSLFIFLGLHPSDWFIHKY